MKWLIFFAMSAWSCSTMLKNQNPLPADIMLLDKYEPQIFMSPSGVGHDQQNDGFFIWGNGDSVSAWVAFVSEVTDTISISFSAKSQSIGDTLAIIKVADDTLSVTDSLKVYTVLTDVQYGDTVKIVLFDYYDDTDSTMIVDHNVIVKDINYYNIFQSNTVSVKDDDVLIAWYKNKEPDLDHYVLYIGDTPFFYDFEIVLTDTFYSVNVSNHEFVNKRNQEYFVVVTAVDTAANESGYSKEVSFVFVTNDQPCDVNGDGAANHIDDLLFDSFYGQNRIFIEMEYGSGSSVLLSFDRCDFDNNQKIDHFDALIYDVDCAR